ncbi:MAG TPA: hypothetical protein VFE51_03205 [Verrucomicrobiae bacterium]|nr:hypothetical protein [Verrucomicrobiae bacterium]
MKKLMTMAGLGAWAAGAFARGAVSLSAALSGEHLVVSWTPSGGTLQSSPTVGPAAVWSTVGTQNPTNIAMAGTAGFFRVGDGVYSSNIVGYATVMVAPGYNLLANPLNAGVTNGANEIMPILDGELILTWSGARFTEVGYDSGYGGWVGADGQTRAAPPSLPPGVGFFLFNPSTTPTNVVFIGEVIPAPGTTNCVSLYGYSLVASRLPVTVNQITNDPINLPAIDGMLILEWSGSNYLQTGLDSQYGGWVGPDGQTPSVAPPYLIGQGFFYYSPLLAPVRWCQHLP